MRNLDTNFVRKQFPALQNEWVFMDNAGGTQVVRQIGERVSDYLYNSNVQLGASYKISEEAGSRIVEAQKAMAEFVGAGSSNEIILGSSTTQLLQNLSRSLIEYFKPGDEVIVTNSDHEANIGPWLSMEKYGIRVKSWLVNTDSLQLELDDLKKLITDKTRLVAFTHASNIFGTINPVEEITSFIHESGAMVCVDGVAYTPHRRVDVQRMDVDFYVFSFYKVFGPHYSLLYAKEKILKDLPGINHYFIGRDEIPYKLQPGNVNYELSYSLLGVIDYFRLLYHKHCMKETNNLSYILSKDFELIADHEENLIMPLIDFLAGRHNVKIIGEETADKMKRVPTLSFIVENTSSSSIPPQVDPYEIGIRFGDFYARRLIESLGLMNKDGVVRVSLVHYNTKEEVNKLITVFDQII